MGQRSIGMRQRRVLHITSTGILVYPIMGAEPGDEDKVEDGSSGTGTTEDDDGDDPPSGTPRIYSEEEYNAVARRMQNADRAKAAAEQKVKEYETKNQSELQKAQAEAQEAAQRAEQAEKALHDQRIHNKFLASNKHTWHDPETALKLLDLDGVEVDDEGNVKGLDEAIAALAKGKPFLLKSDAGDTGKKDKKDGGKQGAPSGVQPPAGGTGNRETDRDRLLKKFPQLAR